MTPDSLRFQTRKICWDLIQPGCFSFLCLGFRVRLQTHAGETPKSPRRTFGCLYHFGWRGINNVLQIDLPASTP